MKAFFNSEIVADFLQGTRKSFLLISFFVWNAANLSAQGPFWIAGTPSTTPTGPASIRINYGIDRTGTVYIAVWNRNFTFPFTSAHIKSIAQRSPADSLVATCIIPVTAGNVNIVLQSIVNVADADRTHTIYMVSEASAGTLQATPVRLAAKTFPCPKLDLLTGFSQPMTCLNMGTTAQFMIVANDDPLISGVMKGSLWSLDWGDGTNSSFTSSADNDLPPLSLRTHTYTSPADCNYVFSCRISNPCGEIRSVQYIAVVHGRDVPSDGDGRLQIVNNTDGGSVIQVCEGNQSVITLRDNSTWNCQNPVLPGGLTPSPNSDPRNIEWLYGRDPSGTAYNTISGSVVIATMGNAPQNSGRILPSPYGPSSQSQAITIPATCRAGEYFRVYLKNWNKCNWADPDFVSTYIDINVVAAPPAPTVPNKTICFGGNRTLTATNTPAGQILWYSDAGLTNLIAAGITYTPTQTAAGTYSFWVVDRSTTGLRCQSAATQVTLTINPIPLKPTINHPNKNDICFDGIETYTMTAVPATPPAITSYQWYKDGVAIPGETSQTIVLSQPSHTGSYTVSTLGIAPSNCPSPQSDPWYVTVHTLSNLTNPVPVTICQNQTATFSVFTTDEVQNWQWEVSTNGGASFTSVGNGPPYSGFNTTTLTITNPPPAFNGYLYRAEIRTAPGQGGCAFKSGTAALMVKGVTTSNAGPDQSLCGTLSTSLAGNSPAPYTGTWTMISGPGAVTFSPNANTPSASATVSNYGTYVFMWTISDGASCSSNKTVTIVYNPSGQVVRPADVELCAGMMSAPFNFTTNNPGGMTTYIWVNTDPSIGIPASGTGNIPSFMATNPGTYPVTSVITVTPVFYNGSVSCPGPQQSFRITVNPQPRLATPLTMPDACSNTVISYTPVSLVPGTTFYWTRFAVSGITPASPASGSNNPDELLRNMTNMPVNVSYQYTLLANGCVSTQIVNVNIKPEPVIQPAQTINVCSGELLNYHINLLNFTNPSDNVSYRWPSPYLVPVTPSFSGGTSRNSPSSSDITDFYVNNSGSIGTAIYTVIPGKDGCEGNPEPVIAVIEPNPSLDRALNRQVCSNVPTGLILRESPGGSGAGYYNIMNITIEPGITPDPANAIVPVMTSRNDYLNHDRFLNLTGTIKHVIYTIQPFHAPSCFGDPVAIAIEVLPQTAPEAISGPGEVCANSTQVYSITARTGSRYAWNLPSGTGIIGNQSSATVNVVFGNSSGPVSVVETNSSGCVTIHNPLNVNVISSATAVLSGQTEICRGDTAVLSVLFNGTLPYTFTYAEGTIWHTVSNYTRSVYSFSASPAVTTRYALLSFADGKGCSYIISDSLIVTVNNPPVLELTGSNISCNNDRSGSVNLSETGNGPFTFRWLGPDFFSSASEDISGLKAGLYSVNVTDIKGCSSSSSVNLTQYSELSAATSSRNISCHGSADGAIYISTPSGGSGSYEYSINGGTSWIASGSFEGLYPGTYNVMIRDRNHPGCSRTLNNTLVLTSPMAISAIVTSSNITCRGANNGNITISLPSGGSGIYQYSVNRGTTWHTSGNFTNLPSGLYDVRIRDAREQTCEIVLNSSLVITEPSGLSATVSATNISCFNSNNGSITASSPKGGSGIYEYTINGDMTWQRSGNFTGLEPGTYDVRVRDASFTSCFIILNPAVTITQPAMLSAVVDFTNVSCAVKDDGTINITSPSGGHGTYEFSINGGVDWHSSSIFTNLVPGTYDVRMRDAANLICSIILDQALEIEGQAAFTGILNPPDICSGSYFSYTPGSTSGRATFDWTREATTGISEAGSNGVGSVNERLTNTTSAPVNVMYKYKMNDNGCISVHNVSVIVNPNPKVDFIAIDPVKVKPGVSVLLDGNPGGGSGLWLQHIWNGDVSFLSATDIQAPLFLSGNSGNYYLSYKVVDNRGCSGSDSVRVEVSQATGIEVPSLSDMKCSVYPNPLTDLAVLRIDNFSLKEGEITYSLFNTNGIFLMKNKVETMETIISTQSLFPGTYFIRISAGEKPVGIIKIIKKQY